MPADMTVKESHDIALILQHKVHACLQELFMIAHRKPLMLVALAASQVTMQLKSLLCAGGGV